MEYTIKKEKKAALLNKLEKIGIHVSSYQIKDNALNDTFSIKFDDPKIVSALKKSSKLLKKENQENPTDIVKMDVPLFIRLLEFAKEDAKDDMELHNVAEKVVSLSSTTGKVVTMKDYDEIVSKVVVESFNPDEYDWIDFSNVKIVSPLNEKTLMVEINLDGIPIDINFIASRDYLENLRSYGQGKYKAKVWLPYYLNEDEAEIFKFDVTLEEQEDGSFIFKSLNVDSLEHIKPNEN